MDAIPTRTTARGAIHVVAFLALALASRPGHADQAGRIASLQALGTQIKLARDLALSGHAPDSTKLAHFRQELANLGNASTDPDPRFAHKRASIQRLLAVLEGLPAHLSGASPGPVTRADVDVETLSPGHGDSCASALGISQTMPVRVTLGAAGGGRSYVWLRFDPPAPGHYRFETSSAGADPAIEIFSGCSPLALAADDDTSGLDVAIATSAEDRSPIMMRVSNSGPAGTVDLSAVATSATVSGRVTDARTGLPLANVEVQAAITFFFVLKFYGTTDQDGNYSIPVEPGNYYVGAYGSSYVTQMYPGVECRPTQYSDSLTGCPTGSAQVLSLADGGTASNIDFALDHGQQIAGQLRDTANQPLNGMVTLADAAGTALESTSTDTLGRYVFSTLPPAIYKLEAQAYAHGWQMFDHVACGGALQNQCDLAQATGLEISDHDQLGINFSLPRLAAIHGSVTDSDGTPLSNAYIYVIDGTGGAVAQGNALPDGTYVTDPLAPGTYYIYADRGGYFDQLFDGVDCPQSCPTTTLANATPITIDHVGQQAQADFQLHRLPVFHGHVQDATTGLPVPDALIALSATPPAGFYPVDSTTTDNNGDYSIDTVPAGTYYVWARSNDHVDQVYPGIACETSSEAYSATAACDVSGAILATIVSGEVPPAFDFALSASSRITGSTTIKAGAGSNMAAIAQVTVYDSSGASVGIAQSDALGHYSVNDLAPGNYFVSAKGAYATQYVQQVWEHIDCPVACAATTGTAIPLAQGTTVNGIDFTLTWRDAIVGRVTDQDGMPVPGVLIDTFLSADGSYSISGTSNALGYYSARPYNFDTYFLATEAGDGYFDQVYSGISCPNGPAYYGLCALTGATPVSVNSGSSQPHIVDFVLQSRDPIFANGFE